MHKLLLLGRLSKIDTNLRFTYFKRTLTTVYIYCLRQLQFGKFIFVLAHGGILSFVTACLIFNINVFAAESGQEVSLRDPTQPLTYTTATPTISLVLQAIFSSAGRKEVIINGERMSEGESSGNMKVLRIEEKQVHCMIDGQRHILRLRPNIITNSK